MPVPFIIIDGYNLMHAAGFARAHYGPGDLERCRNQFLLFLAQHLTSAQRSRTTIVFDAANAPSGLEQQMTWRRMAIEYATHYEDADALIEELVLRTSAPRQTVVISSDHRLHNAARRRKATPIDSEDFVIQLEERGPVATTADEPPPQPSVEIRRKHSGQISAAESEEWLAIFGDIEIPEVLNSLNRQPTDDSANDDAEADQPPTTSKAGDETPKKKPATSLADQEWEEYITDVDAELRQWIDEETLGDIEPF